MGAHSVTLAISVQADLGRTCEVSHSTDGDSPVRNIVLDEAFVERVRTAYADLDMAATDPADIVGAVVAKLTDSDEADLVPVRDVEYALDHLLNSEVISLPELVGA